MWERVKPIINNGGFRDTLKQRTFENIVEAVEIDHYEQCIRLLQCSQCQPTITIINILLFMKIFYTLAKMILKSSVTELLYVGKNFQI